MVTTATPIDIKSVASLMMTALADLQGYLSTSLNPDRIALTDLEMEPMGWTRKAHSPKAFEIWRKQLELFRDDPLVIHHMAIMHHARAFELENGPSPSSSDKDWTAALGYWHRLVGMDAFWQQIAAKACAGGTRQDAVAKLRAEFPQMLLAVHYDIALDKETREKRKSRAKFHIDLVQKSPFDAETRRQAQRAAYGRFVESVPDEVWQHNELREEVLATGQKVIVEYLDFDPGCIPALEDALRLQRRVQRSRNTTWRALAPEDPKRKELLNMEKKDADRWRPFFDQLLAVVDQLDDDVREDLSFWYRGRGHDLRALDCEEQAVEFFERAAKACRPDSDEHKGCIRDLVICLALVARERAEGGKPDAASRCDSLNQRPDITTAACFLLAQAYMRLGSFDAATAVCDKGLAIEPDFDDMEADEWLNRVRELKQQIPAAKLLRDATDYMQERKFRRAVQALDEAAKLGVQMDMVLFLRAQAHIGLNDLAAARRDARAFAELAKTDTERQHAKQLMAMIDQADQASAIGGLLDKAKKAMEAGEFAGALGPLNEAAAKSPGTDIIYFMRAQVHTALGNAAAARRDVKTVSDLAQTPEDREHVKRLEEMLNQAESAGRVNDLVKQAHSAMESGSFSRAESLLNQAAAAAPTASVVYFLRAQAKAGQGNRAGAKADAAKFAGMATSPEETTAAANLTRALSGMPF